MKIPGLESTSDFKKVSQIEYYVRMSAAQILLFVMLCFSMVPSPFPETLTFFPNLFLMALYYWAVFRPSFIPLPLVFAYGLLIDSVAGFPIGLNALLLMLIVLFVRGQRHILMSQTFPLIWTGFVLLVIGFEAVQYGIMSLTYMQFLEPNPSLYKAVASVIVFPLICQILVPVHRMISVVPRMLAKV